MTHARRWIASGIALWALPGLAVAEEAAPAVTGAAPLLHGKLELSLADAIQMGLENNTASWSSPSPTRSRWGSRTTSPYRSAATRP
jgi:hypothetical protein